MMNNTVTYGSSCDEGDNCYDLRMQNQPDCTHGWTLHGLWPQWAETCTEEKFDKSQVSSILDRLNSGWPSCQGPAEILEPRVVQARHVQRHEPACLLHEGTR